MNSLPTYLNVLREQNLQQQQQQQKQSDYSAVFQQKQNIIVNSIISIVTSSGGHFIRPIIRHPSKVIINDINTDREVKIGVEDNDTDLIVLKEHHESSQESQDWSFVSHKMMELFTLEQLKRAASSCYRKGILRSVNHRHHHSSYNSAGRSIINNQIQKKKRKKHQSKNMFPNSHTSSTRIIRARIHDHSDDEHHDNNNYDHQEPRMIRMVSIHHAPNQTFIQNNGYDDDNDVIDEDNDDGSIRVPPNEIIVNFKSQY